MKSTKGNISGGFLRIPWTSGTKEGVYAKDPLAFLFSVDHKLKFVPTDDTKAVYFKQGRGPRFGDSSLSVTSKDLMNA